MNIDALYVCVYIYIHIYRFILYFLTRNGVWAHGTDPGPQERLDGLTGLMLAQGSGRGHESGEVVARMT